MGDDLTFDRIKYVTLELLATSQQQHNPNHIENFQKWICSGEYLKGNIITIKLSNLLI